MIAIQVKEREMVDFFATLAAICILTGGLVLVAGIIAVKLGLLPGIEIDVKEIVVRFFCFWKSWGD